ncbi:GIY-YIG nuclease family protein [Nocardia tengchongensis]|uniref:GIY-YIG nuclease family protein n=1 Tax=Nocardia tengchongensis TaxID=2055889 RepID=UPI0036933039
MSSQGKASLNAKTTEAKKRALPARDVQEFRANLAKVLSEKDSQGRSWASSRWGVYAFYDYDGEPIYVGQTNEQLRVRIQRHLTNQRTDAVAMRILDTFEVAEVEVWPLWDLEEVRKASSPKEVYRQALDELNQCEYTAYCNAIETSRFKAILNEKIPPVSELRETMPPSIRRSVVSDHMRDERGHPDIRIARRAETLARLAAVARERGEVSAGLRRVVVVQAVRLAYLSAARLADVEGLEAPDPTTMDVTRLVGQVKSEHALPDGPGEDADDAMALFD